MHLGDKYFSLIDWHIKLMKIADEWNKTSANIVAKAMNHWCHFRGLALSGTRLCTNHGASSAIYGKACEARTRTGGPCRSDLSVESARKTLSPLSTGSGQPPALTYPYRWGPRHQAGMHRVSHDGAQMNLQGKHRHLKASCWRDESDSILFNWVNV